MTLGFIVLRHVTSLDTDRYWKLCYERIRQYYPENEIIIIDDNSNYVYVDTAVETLLYKTTVIRSLWAGRGELLPYFYYVNYGWFDNAVILHDSVFINKPIDFLKSLKNGGGLGYIFLWEFEVKQDKLFMEHHHDEVRLIRRFGSSALDVDGVLDFHTRKDEWKGCFGAMSVVQLEYLKKVNKIFRLSNLLDGIAGRFNRMSFERIIACLFQYYDKSAKGAEAGAPAAAAGGDAADGEKKSIFGNIFKYCKWGIGFEEAIMSNELPLVKVWTGR